MPGRSSIIHAAADFKQIRDLSNRNNHGGFFGDDDVQGQHESTTTQTNDE